MAQGKLGLCRPHPAEIHPAAQRVKSRVCDSEPDAQRPAEQRRGRLGERAAGDRAREPSIRENAEHSLIG